MSPTPFFEQAQKIQNDLSAWRRHLHRHPELSGQEAQTQAFVKEKLQAFGLEQIDDQTGVPFAVVAEIWPEHILPEKRPSAPLVALRADMDALPIHERHQCEYSSQNEGVMHACGHDAHTAILLGAAQLLWNERQALSGGVRLIFQPAEERIDMPGAGALVEAGVLKGVSAIFGLHVFPELPVGQVGTRPGPFMASADVFHIAIKGKGTHASRPHMGVDPVIIAAQAINSLHHLVSRKVDPLHPAVLTIGKIEGGNVENVIPDEVRMAGTVRTLDFDLRDKSPQWMEKTLWGITVAYGGAYTFDYSVGTPPVINNPETTAFAMEQMAQILGPEQVVELEVPSMGGEDFGEFLKEIPGTFIRLGVRNEAKGIQAPLHSSQFDMDEDALAIGAAVLTGLAQGWLLRQ